MALKNKRRNLENLVKTKKKKKKHRIAAKEILKFRQLPKSFKELRTSPGNFAEYQRCSLKNQETSEMFLEPHVASGEFI